jgi:hypothetical protein
MFNWLRGPGSVFKDPLPGSTNYLSAYNQSGELIRVRVQKQDVTQKKGGNEEMTDIEDPEQLDESSLPLEQRSDMNRAGENPIPKELARDLKPFPVNNDFISQRVLSEELRQEIWNRVRIQGHRVREVSAALGVEMRRVAAVVRLVELEKEMHRQVCSSTMQ